MKMTEATYQKLKTDIHAVFAHQYSGIDDISFLYGRLLPMDMWRAFDFAHINRCYEEHPQITRDGRCLDHTGEHFHDLIYKVEDLDDSHVRTAFRRMIKEWEQGA